jgi:hypothetical protein
MPHNYNAIVMPDQFANNLALAAAEQTDISISRSRLGGDCAIELGQRRCLPWRKQGTDWKLLNQAVMAHSA